MRRSGATARQGLGISAVVMFAGAQLGAVVHVALVEHVRCVEHGDLVHQPAAVAPADVAPAADPMRLTARSLDAPGDHAGHDHCALAAAERSQAVCASERGFSAAPRAVATPCADGYSPLERRLLAPKTSPPPTRVS